MCYWYSTSVPSSFVMSAIKTTSSHFELQRHVLVSLRAKPISNHIHCLNENMLYASMTNDLVFQKLCNTGYKAK